MDVAPSPRPSPYDPHENRTRVMVERRGGDGGGGDVALRLSSAVTLLPPRPPPQPGYVTPLPLPRRHRSFAYSYTLSKYIVKVRRPPSSPPPPPHEGYCENVSSSTTSFDPVDDDFYMHTQHRVLYLYVSIYTRRVIRVETTKIDKYRSADCRHCNSVLYFYETNWVVINRYPSACTCMLYSLCVVCSYYFIHICIYLLLHIRANYFVAAICRCASTSLM